MPTTNGYDPKKAAAYNKLIQSGMSEDAAFAQSGITDAEAGNYALGSNGQLGATVAGAGKVAGVDFDRPTAAETAESARFDRGLQSSSNFEQVDYAEKASAPPGSVKPITYTTTSTETVSGGGSTSITAGPRQPTASSQSLQPAINAKQAEIDQFIKDNPSDFARKKQGLPPLSPEEKQQRQEQLDKLTAERGELKNQQVNAETPGTPTVTTTPNTTTTTQTVTTGTASTNQQVDPETDQKLSQENEVQLDATPSAANASTAREAAPVAETQPVVASGTPDLVTSPEAAPVTQPQTTVDEFGQVVAVETAEPADDPYETERLRAEQSLDDPAPTMLPEDVGEEDPFEAERLEREQELNRQELADTLTEPEPVDADQDPALRTPDGQEEDEGDAGTGLREPTEEDVAAAEQAAAKANAINQATRSSVYKKEGSSDWRVRLQLAPTSNYLYNQPEGQRGILAPLYNTNGVIFPYTPAINTSYKANYEQYDLVHSNYRGVYYKNSRVDDLNIRASFTAQDTNEANYLLAVIHFFRSVTKMFYGKDAQRGTPPPLVFLSGLGMDQFYGHPCVVSNFQYNLPDNVDYIRATSVNNYGTDLLSRRTASAPSSVAGLGATGQRILNAGLEKFFPSSKPAPDSVVASVNSIQLANYVPTKMEIDITLIPVQTRSQVSKQFSLQGFANGDLIKGGFW